MSVPAPAPGLPVPAPLLGLFSDGFEARPLPYPGGLRFAHACDPSHRFLFSLPDDWYGRWSVRPWRPPADAVPLADIVALVPRRVAPARLLPSSPDVAKPAVAAAGPALDLPSAVARRALDRRPGPRDPRPAGLLRSIAAALGRCPEFLFPHRLFPKAGNHLSGRRLAAVSFRLQTFGPVAAK